MSSYQGQQQFPFGYNPEYTDSLALPETLNPGPPPGPPLLNGQENQQIHSFFSDFDADNLNPASQPALNPQFHGSSEQSWHLPPNFAGSYSSLGTPGGVVQMSSLVYSQGMPDPAHFDPVMQVPVRQLSQTTYPDPLLDHLQSIAPGGQSTYHAGWSHPFLHQNSVPMHVPTGPQVRFGSDSHFNSNGYAAPHGQEIPDLGRSLDWLEAQSSATNTQPNTEPNTQPSSPNWSKRRKVNDYHAGDLAFQGVNGFENEGHGQHTPPTIGARSKPKRRRSLKKEQSDPSPPETPTVLNGTHADLSQDDDESSTEVGRKPLSLSSPTSRPTNKARPSRALKAPAKASPRKSAVKTSARPDAQPLKTRPMSSASHTSISHSRSNSNSVPRVPLSAAQKKANHTNSEQRRRHLTGRAFAELYDLVPELEELGKQSTMKKLEVVVEKLTGLVEGNAVLNLELASGDLGGLEVVGERHIGRRR